MDVSIDVVIVSYNSRDGLRDCVAPLAELSQVRVIVVDNASTDRSLETLEGLDAITVANEVNGGFAQGCNIGWRKGAAPFVLLLNPDATIDAESLRRLAEVLGADAHFGAVGPRIVDTDGSLDYSIRRFPRLRSTFAQALFLHRLFPRAPWSDELVRDDSVYEQRASPDWVSGACILVRRTALEQIGGLDEEFFLYCEDKDLCRRLRDAGHAIGYVPEAVAVHEGGASAPRYTLLPILATSRIRYARKHMGPAAAFFERIGLGLKALTHIVLSKGGLEARRGHLRSLGAVLMYSRVTKTRRRASYGVAPEASAGKAGKRRT